MPIWIPQNRTLILRREHVKTSSSGSCGGFHDATPDAADQDQTSAGLTPLFEAAIRRTIAAYAIAARNAATKSPGSLAFSGKADTGWRRGTHQINWLELRFRFHRKRKALAVPRSRNSPPDMKMAGKIPAIGMRGHAILNEATSTPSATGPDARTSNSGRR